MILSSKQEIRHIYLTDKHSANIKPSWYGESIGRYEGNTLVVDTIGIDERTWVDGFGTPHTKDLHVIERFHLIEDGAVLEANVRVEDPGAFTMPWSGIQRFRQYEAAVRQMPIERIAQLASAPEGPLRELICAENPNSFFANQPALQVPVAVKPCEPRPRVLGSPSCLPSGSVMCRNWPPGYPSRKGWISTFTVIPGMRVLGTQPCRAKPDGAPSSTDHWTGLPSLSATIRWIQLCGLVHWNSLTVPSTVIVFSASNIAKE
jgi:hypothetical protein